MGALALVVVFVLPALLAGQRLETCGNHFMYNGEHVFMSGGNLPWIQYAHDYGNHQWAGVKDRVSEHMKLIKEAGGNTIRLFIHCQGETSPLFNTNGYVLATDMQDTFKTDFKDMLDLAQSFDLLVIPTLWNMAVDQDYSHRLDGLVVDWRKLESYVQNALTPLVQEVKGHPAIGAWDIINEPEGMLTKGVKTCDPCFDSTLFNGTSMGWSGEKYNYEQILRFINWQADAIKKNDPGALVTVGAWTFQSDTDNLGMINHYTDGCLLKAGLRAMGKLDFYQVHSYSSHGKFQNFSPFRHQWSDYGLSKPVVVGEFWSLAGANLTDEQLYEYVYTHEYAGALGWHLKEQGHNLRRGMSYIKNMDENGKINIDLPPV